MTQAMNPCVDMNVVNFAISSSTPLTVNRRIRRKDLETWHCQWERMLTDVDDIDIHAEALAREVGLIPHVITSIPDCEKPMKDGSPDTHLD